MNVETAQSRDNPSDQRYFPRWEVNNRVLYQLEDQADIMQGKTKDLSCAGACIAVDRPLTNQKIKLTFFLSRNASVDVEGNVLWSLKTDEGDVEIGVAFTEISPQSQDLILQHAFEVNREEVVRHWFDGWNDNAARV